MKNVVSIWNVGFTWYVMAFGGISVVHGGKEKAIELAKNVKKATIIEEIDAESISYISSKNTEPKIIARRYEV